MSPSPAWHSALPFALCLAGCVGELELRLLPAGFEEPLGADVRLSVEVLDADFSTLSTFEAFAWEPVTLGEAEPGSRRIRVIGRGPDGGVVASGYSQALEIDGSDGRVLVPFAPAQTAVGVMIDQALRRGAVVDGLLDEWVGAPSVILDDSHRVAGPSRPEVRAELLVGWDFDQLRFAVRVVDRCVARGACQGMAPGVIVLALDGPGRGGERFERGGFMVAIRRDGIKRLAGQIDSAALPVAAARFQDHSGWVVEGAVDLAALDRSAIAQRDRMGLELAVQLAAGPGSEPTVLRLSGIAESDVEAPVSPVAVGRLGFGAR